MTYYILSLSSGCKGVAVWPVAVWCFMPRAKPRLKGKRTLSLSFSGTVSIYCTVEFGLLTSCGKCTKCSIGSGCGVCMYSCILEKQNNLIQWLECQ